MKLNGHLLTNNGGLTRKTSAMALSNANNWISYVVWYLTPSCGTHVNGIRHARIRINLESELTVFHRADRNLKWNKTRQMKVNIDIWIYFEDVKAKKTSSLLVGKNNRVRFFQIDISRKKYATDCLLPHYLNVAKLSTMFSFSKKLLQLLQRIVVPKNSETSWHF